MLCGCIDIGSNTTRLLVADAEDGRLREVLQQRAYTRLLGQGPIPREGIAAVVEAVEAQARVAHERGCTRLRVVGTAALREAPNRRELLRALESRCGLEVDVLSGEDEARLAFAGATRTLQDPPDGEVGVVDVGGGSTELVVGTRSGGVAWSASFRVGSGFLAEHYLSGDPPSEVQLDRVRRHVSGVFEGVRAPRPAIALAVGGSAGSLRRMVGEVVDSAALERGVELLASMPAAEAARRFCLDPERVRVLPAGMLLLQEAAAVLGAPLRIGLGGLREGVLLEEAARATDVTAVR